MVARGGVIHGEEKVQPYIKVPQALLGRMSYECAILYGALAYFLEYPDSDAPKTTVSNQALAERMGCTDRTVRRLLSKIPKGYIMIEYEEKDFKDQAGVEFRYVQKRTIFDVFSFKENDVKHNLTIPLSLVKAKIPAGAKLLYGLTRNLARKSFPQETSYVADLMKVNGRGAQKVLRWLRALKKSGFIEMTREGKGYQIKHSGLGDQNGGGHR